MTATRTARTITVGTVLADGDTVHEITPSVTIPGHITFLVAADGRCAAMVVAPDELIEVAS